MPLLPQAEAGKTALLRLLRLKWLNCLLRLKWLNYITSCASKYGLQQCSHGLTIITAKKTVCKPMAVLDMMLFCVILCSTLNILYSIQIRACITDSKTLHSRCVFVSGFNGCGFMRWRASVCPSAIEKSVRRIKDPISPLPASRWISCNKRHS